MEKIKTIGDAFMATANLLEPHTDPVGAAMNCAFEMAGVAHAGPCNWNVHAGIDIGPVVAGVVGRRKFSFDLLDDTVNLAPRLSAIGNEVAVYLSKAAFRGGYQTLPVSRVEVKGMSAVEIWGCAPLLDSSHPSMAAYS